MMFKRADIRNDALRKECLDAIRHWKPRLTAYQLQLKEVLTRVGESRRMRRGHSGTKAGPAEQPFWAASWEISAST